jgi:hypothetical protein
MCCNAKSTGRRISLRHHQDSNPGHHGVGGVVRGRRLGSRCPRNSETTSGRGQRQHRAGIVPWIWIETGPVDPGLDDRIPGLRGRLEGTDP